MALIKSLLTLIKKVGIELHLRRKMYADCQTMSTASFVEETETFTIPQGTMTRPEVAVVKLFSDKNTKICLLCLAHWCKFYLLQTIFVTHLDLKVLSIKIGNY